MRSWKLRYLWAVVVISTTLLAAASLYFTSGTSGPPVAIVSCLSPQQAWEAAQPHIATADDETTKAVDRQLKQVRRFFEVLIAEGRLQRFADEALSWSAKYKLVVESRADFDAYVAQRFKQIVFSEKDVRDLLASVIADYQNELDATDNNLLVALRTDTDTRFSDRGVSLPTIEQIHERLAGIVEAAQTTAAGDLPGAIAREIGSFLAGEVLTQVATQALTSAGILGAGTASGVMTFGVGILVGLGVDYVVQEVTAPQEQLIKQLRAKLFEVRNSVLAPTGVYLEEVGRQRSAARRQIVAEAIGVIL
jgi:hypothetical protein